MRLLAITLAVTLLSVTNAQADDQSIATIKAFIKANNEHNVEEMVKMTTHDVMWMNVENDGVYIEVENQQQLTDAMTLFFSEMQATRAEISNITTSGPFISFTEKAFWTEGDQEQSQCALGVYELSAGQIKNVWYHAAYDC